LVGGAAAVRGEVRIIAGTNVWICDECVQLCCDVFWPDEAHPVVGAGVDGLNMGIQGPFRVHRDALSPQALSG
jgi:ATP-dependent protease Clp ATPase subunit